jgi:hypothetical protein
MNITGILQSKLPPLYKLDNNGALREWRIEAEADGYTIRHGIFGKQLRSRTIRTTSKNGRLKAYQSWKNMLEENYTVNLSSLLGELFSPMKLVRLRGNSRNMRYPVLVHRNYGGYRCIAREKTIFSENGELLHNLRHILKWTKKISPVVYLEGDLYSGKLTVKQLKTALPEKESEIKTTSVKFVVYDAFIEDIPDAPYEYRKMMVDNIVKSFREQGCNCIESADLYTSEFPEIIEGYKTRFENEGYGGIIIRNSDGIYRPGEHSTDVFISDSKTKPGKSDAGEVKKAKDKTSADKVRKNQKPAKAKKPSEKVTADIKKKKDKAGKKSARPSKSKEAKSRVKSGEKSEVKEKPSRRKKPEKPAPNIKNSKNTESKKPTGKSGPEQLTLEIFNKHEKTKKSRISSVKNIKKKTEKR